MAEHQGQTPLLEGPYTCSNGRRNEQPSKARTIKTIIGYAICGAVLGLVGAERWGLEEVLESAKLMGVVFGVAGGLMGCIAGMNVQLGAASPALAAGYQFKLNYAFCAEEGCDLSVKVL